MYVGVNGERGPSHREREHARGCLYPYARQRRQVILGRRIAEVMQAAEVNATLAFADGIEDLLDAARFLAGEAAAADRVLDLPGRASATCPQAGNRALSLANARPESTSEVCCDKIVPIT